MSIQATVVFADLMGSTSMFETIGNARASKVVTQLTQWIGQVFSQHQGRVIKMLGDGVLATFEQPADAIHAVVDLQRQQQARLFPLHASGAPMPLRIGVARGDVEFVGNDCFGDAVNVAARLSDLCGPDEIWASVAAVESSRKALHGIRFRPLGAISIRGRAETCDVLQVEWRENLRSDFLTQQADVNGQQVIDSGALGGRITLACLDVRQVFPSSRLPIQIGRVPQADFVVNDPRVSRAHARLDWRNGSFVLVDTSSYGSWLRFAGSPTDVLLRREECVLHGAGEIALGVPFTDISAPTVTFEVA